MLKRQRPRIRIGAPPGTYPRTPSREGSFQEKGLLPREHLADRAYLSADLLVPGAASPGRCAREIKKGPRELTLHAQEQHLALVEARRAATDRRVLGALRWPSWHRRHCQSRGCALRECEGHATEARRKCTFSTSLRRRRSTSSGRSPGSARRRARPLTARPSGCGR